VGGNQVPVGGCPGALRGAASFSRSGARGEVQTQGMRVVERRGAQEWQAASDPVCLEPAQLSANQLPWDSRSVRLCRLQRMQCVSWIRSGSA
jgi:hypothetical protein